MTIPDLGNDEDRLEKLNAHFGEEYTSWDQITWEQMKWFFNTLMLHYEERRWSGARCYDCNLPYGEDGFEDFLVQNDIWQRISPTGDEGGILCANCICCRLTKAGISGVPGAYMSGPIDTVSEHVMEALLIVENCWERVQNFPKQTLFHPDDEEE